MDPNELANIYESLSLFEKAIPKIKINILTQIIGATKIKKCLMGKVRTTKPIDHKGFGRNMKTVSQANKVMSIECLDDNSFILHFTHEEDKRRILVRGLWHYGNSLIILTELTGIGHTSKIEFSKAIFWI